MAQVSRHLTVARHQKRLQRRVSKSSFTLLSASASWRWLTWRTSEMLLKLVVPDGTFAANKQTHNQRRRKDLFTLDSAGFMFLTFRCVKAHDSTCLRLLLNSYWSLMWLQRWSLLDRFRHASGLLLQLHAYKVHVMYTTSPHLQRSACLCLQTGIHSVCVT